MASNRTLALRKIKEAQSLPAGQEQDTLALYDEAIELDPLFADTYRFKANILRNLGQLEAVLALYEKSLELEPEDVLDLLAKSMILSELGRVEEGLATIETAIKINPRFAESHNIKGWFLLDSGDYEGAIQAYDGCIKLNAQHGSAYMHKGLALYNFGNIEEAINHYDKQCETTPGSDTWEYYALKGKALYDLNKLEEGEACYQKTMEIMNQGTLKGNKFTTADGKELTLSSMAKQLVVSLQEISGVLGPQENEVKPQELKVEIQTLNEQKEALKLKFINTTVLGVGKRKEKQQEEMDALKKELEDVKEMQTNLNNQVAEVTADSPVNKDLAEVKLEFKAFEDQDPELLAYSKTFNWTAIKLFGAYRTSETRKNQAFIERTKKVFNDAFMKKKQFKKKVAVAINSIIESKLGTTEEEISISVSKIALAMTRAKESAILNPGISTGTTPKVQAGLQWVSEKVDAIKEKALLLAEVDDKESAGAALALQDATLLMAYLYKNQETVVNNEEPLDEQLETIVKAGGLEELMDNESDMKEIQPIIQENLEKQILVQEKKQPVKKVQGKKRPSCMAFWANK